MALQSYVFYRKHAEPSHADLQAAIDAEGFDYRLPPSFAADSRCVICVRGTFEGLESCFDYGQAEYRATDWNWLPPGLMVPKSPNVVSAFNVFSNAQEVVGMLVVSSVLTKLTDGAMYSEFFQDDFMDAKDCVQICRRFVEEARHQFDGPSKLRRAETD